MKGNCTLWERCSAAVCQPWLLAWTLLVMLAGALMSGCSSDTKSWKEEVRLLDGRLITVKQKRRYEGVYTGQDFGSVVREAWLTFKLPEFGDQEIIWHEGLMPRILNVYEGSLYIVGMPHTGREFREYGKPKPTYIGYRYGNGEWLRIPFAEIPEAIYDINLWIESFPPGGSGNVSLGDKEVEMLNPELGAHKKRVDPNYIMMNI